ncbi:MAG: hypothetical protein K9M98_05445 [Cephaloticoccus sp.]|nr:hypothetical protein [Cephaloticoccus sp.]MCF7759928.1 hypothetical protein [Cephaloticoccus sp.]
MQKNRRKTISFDPKDPAWGRKLWVRLKTSDGSKIFIIWSRVWKVAVVLALAGWLGLAGAAWAFVKYKRGITEASYVDIALFPLRHRHYRETLSTHYQALAQKQLEAGEWSKALVSLRLAIANNAKNLPARQQLADIYRQIQRPDFAIDLLEAGLKEGATDISYLRDLFKLLQSANRNERIITLGSQFLPATPDADQTHQEIVYQIVRAELRLKQTEKAKLLLQVWKLDNTLDGQLLLADLENADGFPDLAVMRLENLARTHPKSEMIGLRLVSLYKEMDRLADARRVAIERMIKFPGSPGAHVDLISLLYDSGDMPAFDREAMSFVTRFARDNRALVLLASAAMRLHEPWLARLVRDKAPKNEAGHVSSVFQVIVMHAECLAGHYQLAIDENQVLAGYPNLSPTDQAAGIVIQAWANYGLGKTTDGETALNQFLTLSTNVLNQHGALLARELDLLDKKAESRRVLLALVERNPGNPNYLTKLVNYDLELQHWEEVTSRLPSLLALDPPPLELLTKIWQLQDVLQLNPGIRQRLGSMVQ